MDETRLKEGTKIKITQDSTHSTFKKGDVMTLAVGTQWHDGDAVVDRDGHYWARHTKEENNVDKHDRICLGKNRFKVLKY